MSKTLKIQVKNKNVPDSVSTAMNMFTHFQGIIQRTAGVRNMATRFDVRISLRNNLPASHNAHQTMV